MIAVLHVVALSCMLQWATSLNNSQCGISYYMKELIVYGQPTTPGEWPWHTAIYHKSKGRYDYACGGTLISDMFVLTAGHCVIASNGVKVASNRILVRFGVHDLIELNPYTVQQRRVEKIRTTGHYLRPSKRDDIALMELTHPVIFNDFVQPACINTVANLTGIYGTAIGWGVTENDTVSGVLRKAAMPVIDTITCLESNRLFFGSTLVHGVLCAGYQNGTAVCNGDSGGGLFFQQGNVWHIGGIISFSAFRDSLGLCATKGFAGFTKVHSFLHWIKNITGLENIDEYNRGLMLDDISAKAKLLLPEECGHSISNRIPFGNLTQPYAYPWMARLQYYHDGIAQYVCDGSLINNRYVVTVATCLWFELAHVVLGVHTYTEIPVYRLTRQNGEEIMEHVTNHIFDIDSTVVHPGYRWSANISFHDIALVRLSREVVMQDSIRPICLPVTHQLRLAQYSSYVIVSWGMASRHSANQTEATVPWVKNADCQEMWGSPVNVTDQHLCVADQVILPCVARLGTPLGHVDYNDGERFVLFGIFATPFFYNLDCIPSTVPSFYTGVVSHMNWILDNIKP